MERSQLETLITKATQGITNKNLVSQARNPLGHEPGRFVLFHAGMSFCSQKVRATLTQKNIAYESDEMQIIGVRNSETGILTPAENYFPDYVRLRLEGDREQQSNFVSGYSGVASVSTQGLDPCAVPTLVDRRQKKVVVDSLRICEYIDSTVPGSSSLVPRDPAKVELMQRHLRTVDVTPHPALLYGFHPDDTRPEMLRELMVSVYDEKVESLAQLIVENSEDIQVVKAYRAKIEKETGGKSVSRDATFQRSSRGLTRDILVQFQRDVEQRDNKWLCGPDVTLADLFWGVSLVRLQYLGLSTLWDDLSGVSDYFTQVTSLKSIRREAINATVQSMPPSRHLANADL